MSRMLTCMLEKEALDELVQCYKHFKTLAKKQQMRRMSPLINVFKS